MRSFVRVPEPPATRRPCSPQPIYYRGASRTASTVEVAMQYTDSYQENIFSFANNIHTPDGGTHLDGLQHRPHPRHQRLWPQVQASSRTATQNLTGEDVREGLTAVISVKLEEPQFEGQTKTKLGNSEVRGVGGQPGERRALHLPGGEPRRGPGHPGQVPERLRAPGRPPARPAT